MSSANNCSSFSIHRVCFKTKPLYADTLVKEKLLQIKTKHRRLFRGKAYSFFVHFSVACASMLRQRDKKLPFKYQCP